MTWIEEPMFFHNSHELNWTPEDWRRGAEVFGGFYGLGDRVDWKEYRNSFRGK